MTKKILDGIENQILFEAKEKKEILAVDQFEKYLNKEVNEAQSAMQAMILEDLNPMKDTSIGIHGNFSEIYIWNKERIKALNGFQEIPRDSEAEFEETYLSEKGRRNFHKIKEYASELINPKGFSVSSIVWFLIDNELLTIGFDHSTYKAAFHNSFIKALGFENKRENVKDSFANLRLWREGHDDRYREKLSHISNALKNKIV